MVISATSIDDIRFHIEGSPELLALVYERLGLTTDSEGESVHEELPPPKVFLSYAWEDNDLASQIAHALQANGIDTWWADWCIKAGDSLRQKIDEGLSECSHFVVLLTPTSIKKPWVNQEMDAALMLKLQTQVKFIPLRYQLPPDQLPPLLRGSLSPAIENPEQDINQLINDIHGITKKPELGPAPRAAFIKAISSQEYSAAANAIAKAFVTATKVARKFDPWMNLEELVKQTGLTEEDVIDAIHELHGMIGVHRKGVYYPESELFVYVRGLCQAWGTDFIETLILSSPKAVTIKGGYNALNSGKTVLKGKLNIKNGSLTVENLQIR